MAAHQDDPPEYNGMANGNPPKGMNKSASMYLNVLMPHKPTRPSVGEQEETDDGEMGDEKMDYTPSIMVQNLLNAVQDPKHKAHKLFCQMDSLKKRGDNYEWRESFRWVKYEESVDEGGKRWSKPHVASLSMHFLTELRQQLLNGAVLLDVECYTIGQVLDLFLDEWIESGQLSSLMRQHVRTLALSDHRFRYEHGRPGEKKKLLSVNTLPELNRDPSFSGSRNNLSTVGSAVSLSSHIGSDGSQESPSNDSVDKKSNVKFLRKIPKGAEVANLMIGGMDDLDTTVCGFMRLNDSRILGSVTEVQLPTRFVFFLFGPLRQAKDCLEMGRCLGTMLVDDVFREVAYKCRDVNDLIAGVQEFIDQVTVLPPGEWDPKIRIEPPGKIPSQEFRITQPAEQSHEKEEESHVDPTLVVSGKPFLGLIRDIKAKSKYYLSDFKDALHVQCFASFVYIFLATLTPNVTFGGMLGKETEQYMGVMECIFAAAVTGVFFALFSGQPMNILGSTGPMLVLEKIIFTFCKDNGWDFLPFRAWIGIWTAAFCLLIVMFDLSALVKYITRFTEESFACLIALIFIYEAFVKLAEIAHTEAPLMTHPTDNFRFGHCYCRFNISDNATSITVNLTSSMAANSSSWTPSVDTLDLDNLTEVSCFLANGAWKCDPPHSVPDAFLLSILLFLGTFVVAIFLKDFKTWPCFPSVVRQWLSDFSVLIAIILFVVIDWAIGLPTPKLTVPTEFKPTRADRDSWFVNPMSDKNPWWLPIAGCLPAILATILIFLDQQITAVIVNRKENLLKKEKGYHLDMLCVCILVVACSLLGLPWYVAATVSAIAHIQSLRKESETTAPGDKPTYLGVREQRVTSLLVGILSGVAVLITNILKYIPMPVLYGVFFYMGYSALRGMQFIDRILLILMPVKYQPDHPYLRHVPLWRVHLYTFIQILCLVALWVVKSIKSISIVFPLLVLFTGVVRKIMEINFTQEELKWLDDPLPPMGCSCPCSKGHQDDHDHEGLKNTVSVMETSYTKNSFEKKEKTNFYVSDEDNPKNREVNGITNKGFDTKL